MRLTEVLVVLAAALADAAINLDGSQAVRPVFADDPSPIADPITYIPDQHDCPLPCDVDYTNVHKWTPYNSVDRLRRCSLPMLLQFSLFHPLDSPQSSVLIRSCTLGTDAADAGDRTVAHAVSMQISNPKDGADLVEASLDVAPACAIRGKETKAQLALSQSGSAGFNGEIAGLLDGMKKYFDAKDNCDETVVYAYQKQTVASLYIGPGLGKSTVASALDSVSSRFQARQSLANRTVAQICGGGRRPATVFGLSIDTAGDLAGTQKAALGWSRGECATSAGSSPLLQQETLDVKVFDIASAPLMAEGWNGTSTNGTWSTPLHRRGSASGPKSRLGVFSKRATCRYIQVKDGDGCASLASKCGIRGADFMSFNEPKEKPKDPKTPGLCESLHSDDYVCCSAGDPYVASPKAAVPAPNSDGTCVTYEIRATDTCDKLSRQYHLTVAQIESFNKGKTWGWTECKGMMRGLNMCLSPGTPPLPPAQQGTECGPRVPGTQRPTDSKTKMENLNPCPLKACCSNWGFCGPFPEHCDVHAPEGAGPGSTLPGFVSTCISNCGTEIKQNSGPPAAFSRIGYYESWNLNRKCLWLKAENANTDGTYTHIHWGFAEIDPNTWKVAIKDPYNQWEAFKRLPNVKRIVSFGGWAYSTEAATFNIIRRAIINNRETFAANLAQFVTEQGLDGVDIDWEYPGVRLCALLLYSFAPCFHAAYRWG